MKNNKLYKIKIYNKNKKYLIYWNDNLNKIILYYYINKLFNIDLFKYFDVFKYNNEIYNKKYIYLKLI